MNIKQKEVRKDLVVIGGGLAGVCASLAAARLGCKVALLQDRPVLGGNSSSEIRVAIGGADMDFLWARETGIIEELRIEDRFRNHSAPANRNGWLGFMWDIILYEAVMAEENLDLFLNTSARKATTDDSGAIVSVEAVQIGTEKTFLFYAPLYVDASGDSVVAADAGAEFMLGRESRNTYNESLAPGKADNFTMGSSILFKAVDTGHPVPFVSPSWAYDYPTEDTIPIGRNHQDVKGGYAWIEAGGTDMDIIAGNEAIRDDLLKVVFGIWDHIKNHGDHGAKNYVLEWVGSVPGKRESRRFYGDYVLVQKNAEEATQFKDRVAYAGWPIDVHIPGGIHSNEPPSVLHNLPSFLSIPWRCLYSRNVPNLMLAGRNISASHIACGTTRLMATGAIMGQAVGTGTFLCHKYEILPRELGQKHIGELQQQLLRDDCYIVGICNEDPDDLARTAWVTASSKQPLLCPEPNFEYDLKFAHAAFLPLSEGRLETIWLPLRSTLNHDVEISARLIPASRWDRLRGESTLSLARTFNCTVPQWTGRFADESPLIETKILVPARTNQEIALKLGVDVEPGGCYWLVVGAAPGIFWRGIEEHPHHDQFHQSAISRPTGFHAAFRHPKYGWVRYRRSSLNFRVNPASYPYDPQNVINGIIRPELWPNIWISNRNQTLPQWIELRFPEKRVVRQVQITFDTNLDIMVEDDPVPPECAKNYALLAEIEGKWQKFVEIKGNHHRLRRHDFNPVTVTALKLEVWATNGDPSARVYEIRAYGTDK